jgi:hypothetical protein
MPEIEILGNNDQVEIETGGEEEWIYWDIPIS